MEKLKNLQNKKLLKELDYIESDFEWTSELISEADTSFMTNLNDILEKYPNLKEKYNEKLEEAINKKVEKNIKEAEEKFKESEEENIKDIEEENNKESDDDTETKNIDNKSKKIKKLYRDIVKITHPDKVKDEELNEMYIKATDYYENNDILGIYKICNDLKIEYDIDPNDEFILKSKIEQLKRKIEFLQSTFTWKWVNAKDDSEKEGIIMKFIKMKLI